MAIADCFELIAEFAACEEAVHFTRAIHLALDANTARQMFEEDAVRSLVDLLPARARTADKFFQQVSFRKPKRRHPLFECGDFVGSDGGLQNS